MSSLYVKLFTEDGKNPTPAFPDLLEINVGGSVLSSDYLMGMDGGPFYTFSLEAPGVGTLRIRAHKQGFTYEFPVSVRSVGGMFRIEFDTARCVDTPAMCKLSTVRVSGPTDAPASHQLLEISILDRQEVILVAGSDYPRILERSNGTLTVQGGGMRKVILALTRMEDLRKDDLDYESHRQGPALQSRPPFTRSTVVTLFDAHTGVRSRWVVGSGDPAIDGDFRWTKGWCCLDRQTQGTTPPTPRTPAPKSVGGIDPGRDAFGITHVYDYIAAIGDERPESIGEWSIFSHSYSDGPILYNTYRRDPYDPGGPEYPTRDPHDHDARISDFVQGTSLDRARMRNAFMPNAHVKIWGCNADREVRSSLTRAAAGHPFRVPDNRAELVIRSDGSFDTKRQTYPDTRRGLQKFLNACALKSHYAHALSYFIDQTVWATPPGLWSEFLKASSWYWNYIPVRSAVVRESNGHYTRKLKSHGKLKRAMSFYLDHMSDLTISKDFYVAFEPPIIPTKWKPPASVPRSI